MWSKAKGEENTEARRTELLQKGYELFSSKTIEAIGMRDVAKAVGCGSTSAYRYYGSKPDFVVAVATWKWEQFQEGNRKRRPTVNFEGMTAAEIFEFYLDSFLLLYNNQRDLLRFNQFFNVYVQSEHIDTETLRPYQMMIDRLKEQFHGMYLKAQQDKTLRTNEPEEKMFSKTLHLMLAVVTRYAVGLVYIPENRFDAMEELAFQKELILEKYKTM
ncbi:MAG: TetR/AcrR family transcriptional regulator [Lachnospiraceae bacterium]|nr:TetR/AcrR family transcriptional regulator [Lachnospiraceae bacterium]